MRIFGSDRMAGMMQRLGLKENEAIVHPWINKALERAQKKVEARNFDTRKNLLKYDDVMSDQRKEVYGQRREFMASEDVSETISEMREEIVTKLITARIPERAFAEQWESEQLAADIDRVFGLQLPILDWSREDGIDAEAVQARVLDATNSLMATKAANYGAPTLRYIEKSLLISTLDAVWKEHLLLLDQLRQGIYLRAHGQRDPLNEYKREAFALFGAMLDELRERVITMLAHVEIAPAPVLESFEAQLGAPQPAPQYAALEPEGQVILAEPPPVDVNDPSTWRHLSRNALCPCGSGRKYKHCHGKLD